jgi:hypothetical protein
VDFSLEEKKVEGGLKSEMQLRPTNEPRELV